MKYEVDKYKYIYGGSSIKNNFKISKKCFINKTKKIIKFVPEKEIKILDEIDYFNQIVWYKNKIKEGTLKFKPYIIDQIKNINTIIDYLRFRFSYSEQLNDQEIIKLQMNNISNYSFTYPFVAYNIINIIKNFIGTNNLKTFTITDAFSNIGGMAIPFCKIFKHVNACEIVKEQYDSLLNNLHIYKLNNFTAYNKDYLDILYDLKQDIIYFDPPWGGPGDDEIILGANNIHILCVINKMIKYNKTKFCILFGSSRYDFKKYNTLIPDCNYKIFNDIMEKTEKNTHYLIILYPK